MDRWTRSFAVGVVTLAVAAGSAVSAQSLRELPPDAKAGECYAKVLSSPKFKTETQRVLKRDASENIEIIPAKYEWVEEKVVVKEGYEKLEVVPAEYKWVEEKVELEPATTRIEQVPASYELAEEKVLVRPAQTVWKTGRGAIERIDDATGEIMCRVEEPAEYKTIKKRVLKAPATTKKIEIPAKYKTVKKQVLSKPETTRKLQVPAKHSVVRVKKLVSPAQEKRIPVPAEYEEITKSVKVSDGQLEWRPVMCQTNMSQALITSLQRALSKVGHDPGPIDGLLGSQTLQAVYDFQRSKGLPYGALTTDTLKALDVSVR